MSRKQEEHCQPEGEQVTAGRQLPPFSFKEYLRKRRRTDTPEGDFVEDAVGDRRFPDAMTWEEVEDYLRWRAHACPEAIQAGRNVWRQYLAKLRAARQKAP